MTRPALLLLSLAALACLGIALWAAQRSGPAAPPDAPASLKGVGCGPCHQELRESPGGPHPPASIGCADCHLGDPTASTEEAAHGGMEREPGALDRVALTCGRADCHVRELARVLTSPMTRADGIVAVDRFAFGEGPLPAPPRSIGEVLSAAHPSPGEDHLRRLCAGCHLGTRRENRDDAIPLAAGSGCGACHLGAPSTPGMHAPVDARVGDDRCLGCHSRSGRISLSYQGLAEVRGAGQAACEDPRLLHDGRPGCALPGDVHHDAGLGCIDCHLHTELMGDGALYPHREEAVEIRCETCHGPGAPEGRWGEIADPITASLLAARGEARPPEETVRLGQRGAPLWNLRPTGPGGSLVLTGKLDGRAHPIPPTPADAEHSLAGHARLSCAACHSAWAPTCAECHTSFAQDQEQWDFGRGALAPGAWVEAAEHFRAAPPALGLAPRGDVQPAAPGMIATLDASAAGGARRELRRFATLDPHTTTRAGRSCAACHRDPWALGLGTGRLTLGAGGPRFEPLHPADGAPDLAADGWTSLLPEAPGGGTRPGGRSFDAREQHRILRVGVCVQCHTQASDRIYADVEGATRRLLSGSSACTQPAWPWLASPLG